MQLQKRWVCFAVFGLLISFGCFAKTTGTIPKWMGDSVIVLSKEVFGKHVTINDWFGKTPKDTANITITNTEKTLTVTMEMLQDNEVALKMTATFIFAKMGKASTCYPSKIHYESPLTFQSKTFTCKSPYDDMKNYGVLMGMLMEILPMIYE